MGVHSAWVSYSIVRYQVVSFW